MSKPPTQSQIEAAMRFYAGGWIVRRVGGFPNDIPPWRYLRPECSVEQAAAEAARALGITRPTDLLVLAWKLGAAAKGRR